MKFIKQLLLLSLIAIPFALNAQSTGQWIIHPKFVSTDMTNCIDTGDEVYYLTSNTLYCYDKETQENAVYDKTNYLNDTKVIQIYYNYDKKYLVVVYENSNIDIILSDAAGGKVINMSEIKDATMTVDKDIKDVTFADGKMYVATAFGYVVINDSKWEVKESRIYNTAISTVAEVGDYLLMVSGTTYYYGLASNRYDRLTDFSTLSGAVANARILPINETRFFLSGTKMFGLRTIAPQTNGTIKITATAIVSAEPKTVQRYPDGYVASFYTTYYYTSDANGDNRQKVTSDAEIFTTQENGNWWTVSANGLSHIVNGERSAYIKPNALSVAKPVHINYDAKSDRLFVSSTAASRWVGERQGEVSAMNILKGSTWQDATITNLPNNTKYTTGQYWPLVDPDNPNRLYMQTWWRGLFVIDDGQYQFAYDYQNSNLANVSNNYYSHVMGTIDKNGNLWVVQRQNTGLFVLPAAKRGSQTTASDWIKTNVASIVGEKENLNNFITTKNNIKVYNAGAYQQPYYIWKDDGTNLASPTCKDFSRFVDQDGKSVTWTYTTSLMEDKAGRVWFTHYLGLGYFYPENAFSGDFNIIRPKVNRNDGTGMADYLLDAVQIQSIAEDGYERKWIGTYNDGVYLVSPDGTEVIDHFTSSNSMLPSDQVFEVCCNPNSNSVYFTTAAGFAEYKTTASDAAADYSNVVAYPNPVRPDYTGLITIKGLMANSLVKIADNAGNVVKQLKSEGGMVTWDGCNENGDRVATGVYFVFASQNENGSSSAAVTKILIVR